MLSLGAVEIIVYSPYLVKYKSGIEGKGEIPIVGISICSWVKAEKK